MTLLKHLNVEMSQLNIDNKNTKTLFSFFILILAEILHLRLLDEDAACTHSYW